MIIVIQKHLRDICINQLSESSASVPGSQQQHSYNITEPDVLAKLEQEKMKLKGILYMWPTGLGLLPLSLLRVKAVSRTTPQPGRKTEITQQQKA